MCLSIVFLLICSFASLNHGALESDLSMGMQQHTDIVEVAIKTFEIDDRIIDCIDIYKQTAFQHPLLINHTLQLKPNYPGETNDYISKASTPRNTSKSCPEGSIPIERMQRNGHSRGNLSRRGLQQQNKEQMDRYCTLDILDEKYYGVKATLNVWNPKVEEQNGYSASQLLLKAGDRQNVIEAGWMVFPGRWGDETRLFTYWTADGYKTTGCYNAECPGFVQTNQQVIVNPTIQPISVYGGEQYIIDLEIFKDNTTGHWWLRLQGNDMGYWPKELFPLLHQGANAVSLGGAVAYMLPRPQTGPEMGSGHFSSEDFQKAAFIRSIQVLDASNAYKNPPDFLQITKDCECYDIQASADVGGSWGQILYFGGPGISETCQ